MYGVNNFEIYIVKISIENCVNVEILCPTLFVPQSVTGLIYRGADKSLARRGWKQASAIEDFEFHISYL
jgi:hypothetical protein